ncbi:MAG: ribonuclease P protein component [Bacteroidaceae bacterium]|nr:ribonuclease P protein component [Bacteroidaceae bacterium]MBR1379879.1 ribonuclease P protein component [Bacteroidaceae bacterium]
MSRKSSDTLSKAERITSRIAIDKLFAGTSSSVTAYPFRVVYMLQEQTKAPVSVIISVPKKRFRNAVDRNRMKRLVREAYRRQKHHLSNAVGMQQEGGLLIAFICITSHMCTYQTVYSSIGKALDKIDGNLFRDYNNIES